MNCIQYVDNDIYCVTLDAMSNNVTSNYIFIMDNSHLTISDITKFSILMGELDNVKLITTYPNIKSSTLIHSNTFTEFRKIMNRKNTNIQFNNIYKLMFEECVKSLSDTLFNVVIVCTKIFDVDDETKKIIDKILTFNKTQMIVCCYEDYFKHSEITIITDNQIEILNNMINKPLLCDIESKSVILGDNFKLDLSKRRSFLVYEKQEITINGYNIVLNEIDTNHNNVLDAILLLLNYNILPVADFLKSQLLYYMHSKDKEIMNKAITLYQIFKNVINKNMQEKINNIEYSDNVLMQYGKHINKDIKYNMIKNVNMISTLEYDGSSIHINKSSDMFEKSCDFFFSSITLSSWFDELENNSCLGLLIKLKSPELVKVGIMDNIIIENITTTYLPVSDYVNVVSEYFEKNKNFNFGDLNNKIIISGTSIGDSNAIIPMYICKNHWLIVKKYLDPLLGIILTHNPFDFTNKSKSIFYIIFTQMTYLLFLPDKKELNIKYIKNYFAYFRTCAEICFENKYNYGIRKMVQAYLGDPLKRVGISMNDKLFAQSLTTGYIMPENIIKQLILYCVEEVIRNNKYNSINIENDIDVLINLLEKNILYDIDIFKGYYKLNSIFGNIFKKFGTYSGFIKMIDNNYGLISDELANDFYNMINNNLNSDGSTLKSLYDLMNIEYDKNKIFECISQGLKHRKNKDRIDAIKNGTYINIFEI